MYAVGAANIFVARDILRATMCQKQKDWNVCIYLCVKPLGTLQSPYREEVL